MEKVIERASEALDTAAKTNYIPDFVWETCTGVAIVTHSEIGFVFSVSQGDGIVMRKNDDGTWGAPSALVFTGAAGGAVFGKAKKQIFLFPTTELGLKMLTSKTTYQLGVHAGIAAGPGREAAAALNAGKKGADVTWSYVFEKGVFLSVGIDDCFIDVVNPANHQFYGKEVDATDIVMTPGAVEIPSGKGVEKLQEKLANLSKEGEVKNAVVV